MKRFLSIFSAAAITFSLTSFTVLADNTVKTGDYVKMGNYHEPLIWRCIDVDEVGQLMLSDKIISLKAFDASGMTAAGSHPRYQPRRTIGSNYWGDSNIRTWLNSDAEDGKIEWPDKNPPIASGMLTGYNEYRNEAGFLNSFTLGELKAIKRVSQRTVMAKAEVDADIYDAGNEMLVYNTDIEEVSVNYDNAYAEHFADTVFLPDVKQINTAYLNRQILGDDYFIGKLNSSAVTNTDYKNAALAADANWAYWVRTPYTFQYDAITVDGGTLVRYVTDKGVIANAGANTDTIGIRPALYLNNSTLKIVSGTGSQSDPYVIDGHGINVLLNGADISFDQLPENINGRVMVPIRAIFEAMGYSVSWSDETKTATATKGEDKITVTIGNEDITYTTHGEDGTYNCDVSPQIISGRTLVPVRAISESAGANVDWNGDTQTVIIEK